MLLSLKSLRLVRRQWPAFAAAAALLIAGCSNSSSSVPNACGAPSGQVALSYPAPNSTGIPDNIAGIVFASTNGLGSSYQALVLQSGSTSALAFATVATAPSPLPSPAATPFPNAIYQESANNGSVLAAATTYAVYLNDSNSTCSPTLLGSFTAQ